MLIFIDLSAGRTAHSVCSTRTRCPRHPRDQIRKSLGRGSDMIDCGTSLLLTGNSYVDYPPG